MKIYNVEQRSEKWHELRQGRITGTVAKRIMGSAKTRDQAFYEILAERLSTEARAEESALDRGVRYEEAAIKAYEEATGYVTEVVGFATREDNPWIANSPDRFVKIDGLYRKGVEAKCLSSANHVKVWLTNEVPEEYEEQGIQYFVVNDDAETVDFVFFDPRISVHPLHIITLRREDLKEKIEASRNEQEKFINKVESTLANLI